MSKLISLSLVVFSLFLTSCSNGDDDVGLSTKVNKFSLTIDGEKIDDFIPSSIAALGTEDSPYVLSIGGIIVGTTDNFFIFIYMGTDTKGPIYSSTDDCSSWADCHTMVYTENGGGDNEMVYSSGFEEGTSTSINFESLEYVEGGLLKGTFSGVIVNDDDEFLNVTDGSFEVYMGFQ